MQTVAEALRREGYAVSAKTDTREALAYLQLAPGEVDLLLTDQTMPVMTGLDLARESMVVRPGLPVIVITGLIDGVARGDCEALGVAAVLAKPFSPAQLIRAVREALQQAPTP